MSTVAVISLFLGLFLVNFALWVMFLRLGLHWARVPGVTMRRVLGATGIVFVSDVAMRSLLLMSVWGQLPDFVVLLMAFGSFLAATALPLVVINLMFKTSFLRTLQAWLPTLACRAIMIGVALFVVRPYLVEAFTIPTNSMAPTILGSHWRGTCPVCESSAYCTPQPQAYAALEQPLMICERFHAGPAQEHGDAVYSGDRILVSKFLKPQRWDLIVFHNPRDPSLNWVMRLVGLPGETITIRDGNVWADGARLALPESLQGIEYDTEVTGQWHLLWGTPDNPAELDDDEYFVLGDFSEQANDSRLWELGAAGHNPYAVPKSHIIGVVTHIYWPLRRWRILR